MKLTAKAKRRWFYENINSYEIIYFDHVSNPRLVWYNYNGTCDKEFMSFPDEEDAKSFLRYVEHMEYWEIFFKFRKFLRYNVNKKGFIMNYDKYNKQLFN